MRRALRIWPLYCTMLLFAFLTPAILSLLAINGSDAGYELDWLMSVCFLENYKMILTDNFPNVSPLTVIWSLCVEEHFYLIWGIALFFIPIKRTPLLVVCAIVLANIARCIFYLNGWAFLDICTNLDYFAYGAIPAILFSLHNKAVAEYISAISRQIKSAYLL